MNYILLVLILNMQSELKVLSKGPMKVEECVYVWDFVPKP